MKKYIGLKNLISGFLGLWAVFLLFDPAPGAQVPESFKQSFENITDTDATYSQYLDESDVYYKKGMEHLRENDFDAAINSLKRSLELAPERTTTRVNLAVAYINRGSYFFNELIEPEKAASDYRNAFYYLKYDGYEPTTKLAGENLHIVKTNLDNIIKFLGIKSRLKVARVLRGEGRFNEAIVEFQEALKDDRDNVEIHEALGDIYRVKQSNHLAVDYYRKALAGDSSLPELHLKYARALQDIGKNDIAVKEFNIALNTGKGSQKQEILNELESIWIEKIKKNPRDASAHMNLGVVLQKKGNFNEAMREYKIAESITPNDITIRLNIGTLFQAKKQPKIALRAYDTILQVRPDHKLARYYKGTALREMGNLNAAIAEFQYVLNTDPNDKMAKEALFETVMLFPEQEDILNTLYTFARNNPHDALAQFKYAFYLHSIDRYREALDYYYKTIKADSGYIDAYLNIATIYKQENNIDRAIDFLGDSLKKLPDNPQLTEMLTSIESEIATTRYQNALQMHTNGEYEKAIGEYEKIIEISEPDSDLYVNLGAAYQALDRNDRALEAYKKAIEIDDGNSTAYYYLGTVLFAQEEYEQALKSYQKALAIDPGNKNIKQSIESSKLVMTSKLLEKGTLEYNQGKYKESLLTLNTALITTPENPEIYYQRGIIYDAMEKYPLAISDYKLALKYNPDMKIAYYAVAVDYDTLGNYTEAKKWYQKFIDRSKDSETEDEYVKYSRQRISQL